MINIFSLKNQKALITGGGSGIGFAISQAMIDAGAYVIITGRNLEKLQNAAKQLGPMADYHVLDLGVETRIEKELDSILEKQGFIDILVNNAGINLKKNAVEVSISEFENIIKTNLNAVFYLSNALAKIAIERSKSLSILMISSMAAYYGLDRVPAYTASKAGVEGLVKTLASEWGKHKIRVNAIAPGFIETAMMKTAMQSDPDRMQRALSRTSLGYFGKPENIAHAAVFLSSEAASYITGVSLRVDGGNAIGF
jgi:NAD(P)-dependent dehydrogenase (short-subunit alcohol dehydrogenase family)